jgi:hypothetical protein
MVGPYEIDDDCGKESCHECPVEDSTSGHYSITRRFPFVPLFPTFSFAFGYRVSDDFIDIFLIHRFYKKKGKQVVLPD